MSTLNRSCRTLLLPLLIACLAVLAGCGAAGSAGDAENTPRVNHLTFTLLDVDPATPPAMNAAAATSRVKVKITQGALPR